MSKNHRQKTRLPASTEVVRYSLSEYLRQRVEALSSPYSYTPIASQAYSVGGRVVERVDNTYIGYAEAAYMSDSVVGACMRVRRDLFRQARFCWREIGDNGPGRVYRDKALAPLDKPWPNGTTGELLSRMITDVDLCGNSYIAHHGDRLRWLRPDWVSVVLTGDPAVDTDVDVLGYVYTPGGNNFEHGTAYKPDDICHWSPIPGYATQYLGVSWMTAGMREIQGDQAATEHKLAFFRNGATLGPIVRLPATMSLEQFKEFVAAAEAAHAGAQNAYKTMYVGGGAEVTLAAADFRQLDLKAVQGGLETRIAALAGVHPTLVGLSEGLMGSSLNEGNFNAARRATADMTLYALWQDACGALSAFVDVPDGSELWIRERDIPFLREAKKDQAEIIKTKILAFEAGIRAGLKPDPLVDAIEQDDFSLLKGQHSNLFSVQLQPAGATPEEEAADEEAYQQTLETEATRSYVERRYYGAAPGERVGAGFKGGGRFKKLSDQAIALIKEFLKGDGEDGDPLEGWTQPQLKTAAEQLGIKPPPRSSAPKIKLALLKHARGGAPDGPDDDEKAPKPAPDAKKATLKATKATPKPDGEPLDLDSLSEDERNALQDKRADGRRFIRSRYDKNDNRVYDLYEYRDGRGRVMRRGRTQEESQEWLGTKAEEERRVVQAFRDKEAAKAPAAKKGAPKPAADVLDTAKKATTSAKGTDAGPGRHLRPGFELGVFPALHAPGRFNVKAAYPDGRETHIIQNLTQDQARSELERLKTAGPDVVDAEYARNFQASTDRNRELMAADAVRERRSQSRTQLQGQPPSSLRKQLADRGLDTSGTKTQLINRLLDAEGSDVESIPLPSTPEAQAGAARTGRAALESAVHIDDVDALLLQAGVPEGDRLAAQLQLRRYNASNFRNANRSLYGERLGDIGQMQAREMIAGLDPIFAHARLSDDVVVYRGDKGGLAYRFREGQDVKLPPGVSRSDVDNPDVDLTGAEWRSPAYESTSADPAVAEDFSRQANPDAPLGQSTVLTVRAPRGTPAVTFSRQLGQHEAEVTLGRGQRFRVVADHGVGADGVRRLEVEIIPVEAVEPPEVARPKGEAAAGDAPSPTTKQQRATKTLTTSQQRQANIATAERLKAEGLSNVAIGKQMGINESSVRTLLAPGAKDKAAVLQSTSDMLRDQVDKKGLVDVGVGVERHIGVSRTKLDAAIAALQQDGYEVHSVRVEQLGTSKLTEVKVLALPGTTGSQAGRQRGEIAQITDVSGDGGRSYVGFQTPLSVSSSRVQVRYADQGGSEADGVIYVRPGVSDLSMGRSRYAQVRIAVDGTHYLKGMAVYKDDLPDGVDLVFNTNKSDTGNKLDALKPMGDDPDNPFGATVRQRVDPAGNLTSALNVVGAKEGAGEEGGWNRWSRSLSSQFASKQSPELASRQLGVVRDRRQAEFDELLTLANPTVKAKLLETFADSTDSAAVNLKAAPLHRQATRVILPVSSLKDTEVYAPTFTTGEKLVLVRYPHGGVFEIPELVVNNDNPDGVRLLGDAPDAIGINHRVAQRLSGADFDGDTVLVIPNDEGRITTAPALDALRDFDPISAYPAYEGMKPMSARTKGVEMGRVSNLITDMTIRGASTDEIARAVRHSMVVIDAEKHKLNYRQSAIDHGIPELRRRYQGGGGAATLISKARAEVKVPNRKPRPASKGGAVDKTTGKRVFEETAGKRTSVQLAEVDDAQTLSSGTEIEGIYAEHSNELKALANEARLAATGLKRASYSPEAKKAYPDEVASLDAKLDLALRNAPLERAAQIRAGDIVAKKLKANPGLSLAEIKRLKARELEKARAATGARKARIVITDAEWAAIQAGAISASKLGQILDNADLDVVKRLARA